MELVLVKHAPNTSSWSLKKIYARILVAGRRRFGLPVQEGGALGRGSGLACVTMISNEDAYLEDWIHYHRAVGVEHFYLYVNEDIEGFRRVVEILEARNLSKVCTVIFWPDFKLPTRKGNVHNHSRRLPSCQELAYLHWRINAPRAMTHLIQIDVDEFVYRSDFRENGFSIVGLLPKSGCLWIVGSDFGSSGHLDFRQEPVPLRFVARSAHRNHSKSISHIESTQDMFNAHISRPLGPAPSACSLLLRLNHYRIKSKEEFQVNKVRTAGYMRGDYSLDEFSRLDERSSDLIDTDLFDLFQALTTREG